MKNIIFVVAFIASLVLAVWGIYLFFKKRRKKSFIILLVSILLFLLSGLTAPSIVLTIEDVNVTTNAKGEGTIKGMTAPNGEVEINDELVEVNKKGEFTYTVTLEKPEEQKVMVKGKVKQKQDAEEVRIIPSKEFKKRKASR